VNSIPSDWEELDARLRHDALMIATAMAELDRISGEPLTREEFVRLAVDCIFDSTKRIRDEMKSTMLADEVTDDEDHESE
jgi:hypothetical protein